MTNEEILTTYAADVIDATQRCSSADQYKNHFTIINNQFLERYFIVEKKSLKHLIESIKEDKDNDRLSWVNFGILYALHRIFGNNIEEEL